MRYSFLIIIFLLLTVSTFGQNSNQSLKELKETLEKKEIEKQKLNREYFNKHNWRVIENQGMAFDGLINGVPAIISNTDDDSRNSTNADLLQNNTISGVSVNGTGMKVYVWDSFQSRVRETHESFNGRVNNNEDGTFSYGRHATAVTGTIASSAFNAQATGIAPNVEVEHYDFVNDEVEMVNAANSNSDYLISNHSYGITTGWFQSTTIDADGDGNADPGWYWAGVENSFTNNNALFGYYSSVDKEWDDIAYAAPHYTIVKSAGNDSDDSGPTAGSQHWHYEEDVNGDFIWVSSTDTHAPDCSSTIFNCIPWGNNAKNSIIVAANQPLSTTNNRYTQASDVVQAPYSSKGPTNDGRIKPDVTATGSFVFAAWHDADNSYDNNWGTSFSGPNVTGNVVLLQQVYNQFSGGLNYMTSDMVKGLISHTANDAGNIGPDYTFGWGLVNSLSAAQTIVDAVNNNSTFSRETINNSSNTTYNYSVKANGGEPLKVTIAWIDPSGTPLDIDADLTAPALINDLDLRITDSSNQISMPWILDLNNPANAATNGDNTVDNIEQVVIDNPTANAIYQIEVSFKGTLTNNSQNFALIVTGATDSTLSVTNPQEKEEFVIFPNPAKDVLNIKSSLDLKKSDYQIYNASGKLVDSGRFLNQVRINKLNSGVYSIVIQGNHKKLQAKFLKL